MALLFETKAIFEFKLFSDLRRWPDERGSKWPFSVAGSDVLLFDLHTRLSSGRASRVSSNGQASRLIPTPPLASEHQQRSTFRFFEPPEPHPVWNPLYRPCCDPLQECDTPGFSFSYPYEHEDGRGSMRMVSGATLSSPLCHSTVADHNVHLDNPYTCVANMETATGEDAPHAPVDSSAPASFPNSTTSNHASGLLDPFTPQSAPASTAELPAAGFTASVALEQPEDMLFAAAYPSIDTAMEKHANTAPQEQRLSAFARLRFLDGSYYMHTYQIVLGRNVELAHRDMHRLTKAQKLRDAGDEQGAEAVLRGKKRKRHGHGARSVVSVSGGIVNAPIAALPLEYQQRRQSGASHSISSSSHPQSGSAREESPEHAPQEVLMQAFDEVPEHLDSFVPEDPNDCPLVPIHPQHVTEVSGVKGPKGISREHAKIYYNFDRGGFDLIVMSRNGMYHEEAFVGKDKVVQLEHGDRMTIGLVEIRFFLPDVALTEEQRARQESTSRPMSFSFENGQGEVESEELIEDSVSEDVSINPKHVFHMPIDYDSEEDVLGEEEEEDEEDSYPSTPEPRPRKQTVKLKLKTKAKRAEPPAPPVKDVKRGYKRKAQPDILPPEPPGKKPKQKVKESQKELPREKGKAPAKEPVQELAKDFENRPEASKTPKSASPTQARKSAPTENQLLADDIEGDGIITAEIAARHNLPEALIGQPLEKRKGPGRPPKDGVMSKRQRSQLLKVGREMERAKAAGEEPPPFSVPITKPKAPRPRKDSNLAEGDDEDVKESVERGDGDGNLADKKTAKPTKPAREPSPPMRIEDYTEEQLQRPSANYVVLIHEAISSSSTGQMNLQQIYSYIERNYPWYKFKTTTSGWQSSVRHNLGQHEAFMKGDKEGKGYNWKINPSVSIEKERRKRQVSPPQVSQTPRQGYYPPGNGYPAPYGQPSNAYYPGMPPHGAPPNGLAQPPVHNAGPRLPPSLARGASNTAASAPQGAPSPSPYASPWAGGKSATSPTQPPPHPYPPPPLRPPSASAPTYGVLYPTQTSAPQTSYGGYATTSPYASTPGRPYTPYATAGASANQAPQGSAAPPSQPSHQAQAPTENSQAPPPPKGYPEGTDHSLIDQLEAFRQVYLKSVPNSEKTIDNAIQAVVRPEREAHLNTFEKQLLSAIRGIPGLREIIAGEGRNVKEEKATANNSNQNNDAKDTALSTELVKAEVTSTAAAIAASLPISQAPASTPNQLPVSSANSDAKPNILSDTSAPNLSSQPHTFTPNMTGPSPVPPQVARPSVEPLTPVPGSPAVPNGTLKKSLPELPTRDDANASATEKAGAKG